MSRGGAREGAGRPVGTTKAVTRKQRQLRAFDDEWELIHRFSVLLKKGRREECENFIKQFDK